MKLKNSLYPNRLNYLNKRQKLFFQLLPLFIFSNSFGQPANYISNGSFEQKYDCNFPYYLSKVKFWLAIDSALSFSGGHLSVCNGYIPYQGNTEFQYPRTGNSFILTDFYCEPAVCGNNQRGYLKNRLKTPLQSGKTYCVKFYVNIANTSPYGIDGFGAYFGNNTIDTITKCTIPLTYLIPQIQNPVGNIILDTLGWVAVTGTFVAIGTEKYCVIGNFKSDAATNTATLNPAFLPQKWTDLCIDDVSCIPLDLPAYAAPGNDVWAIPGTTIYLGRPQDVGIDEACEWFKLPNTTSVIANAAGLTLTVAITTNTYMVKQTICGIINYDTVVVHASGVGLSEKEIIKNNVNVFPNPANDNLYVALNFDLEKEFTKIEILNSLGQLIREEEIVFKNKTATIKTDNLADGVYLLNIKSGNSLSLSKRFVVAKQ